MTEEAMTAMTFDEEVEAKCEAFMKGYEDEHAGLIRSYILNHTPDLEVMQSSSALDDILTLINMLVNSK